MSFNLRWDVECAIRAALPSLKSNLDYAGLEYAGSEEEMIAALVSSLAGQVVNLDGKAPTPITRHEECQECDALILVHQGRDSWGDPGDGEEWYTHCTVCSEIWPCPEAGELDTDEVARLRARYAKLTAETEEGDLDPFKHRELRRLHRRLEAESVPPTTD